MSTEERINDTNENNVSLPSAVESDVFARLKNLMKKEMDQPSEMLRRRRFMQALFTGSISAIGAMAVSSTALAAECTGDLPLICFSPIVPPDCEYPNWITVPCGPDNCQDNCLDGCQDGCQDNCLVDPIACDIPLFDPCYQAR